MTAKKLSAARIRMLNEPGRYADGNGLYLQVRCGARGVSKSWVFRYMRQGSAHTMGLGPIILVSLAEARFAATEAQKQLYLGVDPIEAKRRSTSISHAPTFKEAANRYIEIHSPIWKNKKHATQWTNTLKEYAEPVLGHRRIDQIRRDDILRVLEPIWTKKAETASRVRGRIEKILDWATVEGHRDSENPARWKGNLEHSLPKRLVKQHTKHLAALPWSDLPSFYRKLAKQEGMAAVALRFTILTAARTGETRFATPNEFIFNNDAGLWTIPDDRMKAGREHRVPLTQPAAKLAQEAVTENQFVFSPFPDKPMSENAMLALLKRMKTTGITVHGFRSTFRDWAAENTTVQREVIETCLAHNNPNQVEAAYLRSDMLEKRRALLNKWSQFVCEVK